MNNNSNKDKENKKKNDEIIDHDFDGIKEKNTPVPTWFNFLLYGTILFAFVYMIYYHFIQDGHPILDEEAASMSKEKTNSSNNFDYVSASKDAKIIAEAKSIFDTNCASCHGMHGEGGVGPNLVDDYWIHEATYKNVVQVIENGVLSKGMPGWSSILGEKKIDELVAYIASLQGTNPPNAKKPEGTPGKLH